MKTVFRIFLVLFGGTLIIESILAAMSRSINLGVVMPFIIGLPLVILGIFYAPISGFFKSGFFGALIKWSFIGAYALFAVLFATTSIIILTNSTEPKDKTADAVIVLGGGIRGDRPSVQLAYRLQKALEYYNAHQDVVLVVSGGQGHDEICAEAEVMKKWLLERGVSPERLIEENRSTSTEENFIFSVELINERFSDKPDPTLAFVTSRFHVFRAERLASRLGIDAFGIPAKEYKRFLLNDYLRECAAIVQHFFTGRL